MSDKYVVVFFNINTNIWSHRHLPKTTFIAHYQILRGAGPFSGRRDRVFSSSGFQAVLTLSGSGISFFEFRDVGI